MFHSYFNFIFFYNANIEMTSIFGVQCMCEEEDKDVQFARLFSYANGPPKKEAILKVLDAINCDLGLAIQHLELSASLHNLRGEAHQHHVHF